MRRLPQAVAVLAILGAAGLVSMRLSPSAYPHDSQAPQPAPTRFSGATAAAAVAARSDTMPAGHRQENGSCVDMPGAIAGLWFVKNNRKHKPEFFMRRVGELAIQVAKAGLDMAFFHDGREGTNDIVHAKYKQNSPAGRYWHTAVALDDLPYQVRGGRGGGGWGWPVRARVLASPCNDSRSMAGSPNTDLGPPGHIYAR